MSSQLSLISALIVLVIFMALSVFQLLLALGKPYGEMAYGGTQDAVLPRKFRLLSAVAIIIFLIASIFILVKIEFIQDFAFPEIADFGIWFFALFLALNTIANATSKSKSERQIMTPLSLIACLGLIIIALSL
jgi:putative copper export protein